MQMPIEHTIVAFYQSRELLLGLVSHLEAANCKIICEDGSSIALNPARFVYNGKQSFAKQDPMSVLREFRLSVMAFLPAFSSRDFSFLAANALSLEQIAAELQLGSDAEIIALYLYLKAEQGSFNTKKDTFRLKSEAERHAYLHENSAKQSREAFLQEVQDYIMGAALSPVSMYQLYGELPFLAQEKKPRDLYKLILNRQANLSPEDAIRDFRLFCGELYPFLDAAIADSGIPIAFSDLLAEEGLIPAMQEIPTGTAFCIDDEDTRDYDDAISLAQDGTHWKLGVHVSSVASRIKADGKLMAEAEKRVSSFYAANCIIPLFPPQLSEGSLSLFAGTVRTVLSYYVWLDDAYKPVRTHICHENIEISANYSYPEVDKRIQEEPFAMLKRICHKLNAARESSHRQEKPRFYYYLKEKAGKLMMQRIDNQSPSRIIVEELMILFNSSLATYATEHDIPMLYRNINQYASPNTENPASQAYLSTTADFHPGIGASAYLHASSPIRRYTDLLNQIQIIASLQGDKIPYGEEELQNAIPLIEKRLNLLKEIAPKSERYWFMKYLESNCLHTPLDACLRGSNAGRLRLEILPWGKQVWAVCDGFPAKDPFKIVIYQVSWKEGVVQADLL